MKDMTERAGMLNALALSVLLLVGCREQNRADRVDPAGATSETPHAVQPQAAEAVHFVVDEAAVGPYAAEDLANAEWTHKACSLDDVNGLKEAILATKGKSSIWSGYLIDPFDAPAGDFLIVLKGATNIAIPAKTGAPRPDVAEYFGRPALGSAGFRSSTKMERVPSGTYSVIFVLKRDGRDYFCESGKEITVE